MIFCSTVYPMSHSLHIQYIQKLALAMGGKPCRDSPTMLKFLVIAASAFSPIAFLFSYFSLAIGPSYLYCGMLHPSMILSLPWEEYIIPFFNNLKMRGAICVKPWASSDIRDNKFRINFLYTIHYQFWINDIYIKFEYSE